MVAYCRSETIELNGFEVEVTKDRVALIIVLFDLFLGFLMYFMLLILEKH